MDDDLPEEKPRPASGPVVPRHRIIDKLGEGGFAIVYRAMQVEPVRREVAVKILRASISSAHVLARFDVERQTLARMDHPGIARLWDAGQAGDGQPYFAMELVRGQPVTTFCKSNKLALADRLKIFVAFCEAVQHAHEKGVLHRDLKPSNLLVADQKQIKVIDFGIAKALEVRPEEESPKFTTSLHQAVGTPGYMSPEQSEWGAHHVDARSDIYALGVVLYELLTGKTPLEVERSTDASARRRPVAWHITPPSKLATTLLTSKAQRRDLDAIVLKALEPESQLRYASAAGLADDVERHLQDKPVEAALQTWTYVMSKFARRHRTLVAMAAIALIAIVAGFGTSTLLYFKEQRARNIADARRKQVEDRDHDLRRALSRADYRAAQNYKRENDYQSAVASLVRSLEGDPSFGVAGADLQTLLAYSELPGVIAAPLKLHPAWGEVKRGGVTADGRRIVAVMEPKAGEKRLFQWDYEDPEWSFRELAIPRGIAQLSLSGRGQIVAFVDKENTVNVIDLRGEVRPARKWKAPSPVSHLVVETRASQTFVGCHNGDVWIVSPDPVIEPRLLFNTGSRIERLLTGSAQRWIIVGCNDGSVWRWRPPLDGEKPQLAFRLPSAITALTQANNGGRIGAGDIQGHASLLAMSDTTKPESRRLHTERITAIAIADDDELITAGRELSLRWTNMTTGTAVTPALDTAGQIEQVAVNHNGEEALVVAADTSVRLWRRDGGTPLTIRKPQHARYVAMSAAGRGLVVTRDEGKAMEVISLSSRSVAPMLLHLGKNIENGSARPRTLAFSTQPNQLLGTDGTGGATLWNTATAELEGSATWSRMALAMAPGTDGKFVAALADGSLIEAPPSASAPAVLLQADVGDELSPVAVFKKWNIAAVSPDGRAAAWSEPPANPTARCDVRVFNRDTGKVRTFHHERIVCLAINADKNLLVLGLNNGVVRITDMKSGGSETYSWHLSTITALAISADGNLLVTGSTDGNVGLWDTTSRQPRSGYVRLGSPVLGVALSADGKRFAASTAHDAFVGDVNMQAIIGPRLPLPHAGGELALNANGTMLAAAGIDGATTLFPIAPDIDGPPIWLRDLAFTFVSRSFTSDGVMDTTSHPGLLALKKTVPTSATGPWGDFAQWLLTHPGARTLSPWTPLYLEEYLDAIAKRPGDASDFERLRHAPAVKSSQQEP
ncbi:MAG: protein kinase [Verrucomicrobiaceae bacterium]|nr:protein kinase [Verrucomicrobiaceae bacterium]